MNLEIGKFHPCNIRKWLQSDLEPFFFLGTVTMVCAVVVRIDTAIAGDPVGITIIMKDQRRLERYIDHSIGNARNTYDQRTTGSQIRRTR